MEFLAFIIIVVVVSQLRKKGMMAKQKDERVPNLTVNTSTAQSRTASNQMGTGSVSSASKSSSGTGNTYRNTSNNKNNSDNGSFGVSGTGSTHNTASATSAASADSHSTTAYLAKKADEDAKEHAREKNEEQRRLNQTRGGLAVAERLYEGDPIPQGKRCVICGYCAAENLVPHTLSKNYSCYFCREPLDM